MKSIKAVLLTAILTLLPMVAFAGSVIIDDFGDDVAPPIPEPTSAVLMMVGFATIVAARRLRK
jgi:uncharacterized membrane protein YgdD (TMEM256/DUF423 family)